MTWCRSRAGLRPSILTRSRLRRAAASGRSLDGIAACECSPRPRWAATSPSPLPAADRLSRPSSTSRQTATAARLSGRGGRVADAPGAIYRVLAGSLFPACIWSPGTAHTVPRCRPNGVSPSDRVPDPARRRRYSEKASTHTPTHARTQCNMIARWFANVRSARRAAGRAAPRRTARAARGACPLYNKSDKQIRMTWCRRWMPYGERKPWASPTPTSGRA